MPTDHFEELNPDEIEYSRNVVKLLKRVDTISVELNKRLDVPPGSKLAFDDSRSPRYPVSNYGYARLLIAVGCLESLGRMILREDERSIEIMAGPYGAYSLVRSALDCAAIALWMLEPQSSTGRLKRRIVLEVDEVRNGAAVRESTGERGWEARRNRQWARLQEVAALAEIAGWDPLSKQARLPKTTDILKALERHHHDHKIFVLPWLSAWQLTSGHAHGKEWVQVATHQLEKVVDTGTEIGANFRVSINYGMLAVLLLEAVQLIESASARYIVLLRPSEQ